MPTGDAERLAQLKAACGGDLERVRRVVRIEGTLHVAPGTSETTAKVLNGASELGRASR